ncbi:MAG: hypothetical protein AVDCRST_MAG13-1590 [uncultured Solirubrobacteraceae bacterium]|uniref:Uncharacterized protein n=1 Tax=uncultured Solirubrobacteraceae bacterium TaxID=1162706 RepID=A0A6J4S9Y9_9ACTN|nr:MAG: hypothetical protein AVDCRST_MAG13-1590 [uncultured Solirubrobacteraceae bacterium]
MPAGEERRGEGPRVGVGDRLHGVLGHVDAAHPVRRVRARAVEDRRGEAGDAAGGRDDRHPRRVAEVPDHVVRGRVMAVGHHVTRPGLRVGQEGHRAVALVDVVERDPARQVRRVLALDVARVLVPAEGHALLGRLHDVLLVEQQGVRAEGRAAHAGHERREEELPQRPGLARVAREEVPRAAVVELEGVHAERVHLGVLGGDEARALAAQRLELVLGQDGLEDDVALGGELLALGVGHGDGHACGHGLHRAPRGRGSLLA